MTKTTGGVATGSKIGGGSSFSMQKGLYQNNQTQSLNNISNDDNNYQNTIKPVIPGMSNRKSLNQQNISASVKVAEWTTDPNSNYKSEFSMTKN
jgi:hypothetical protein